MLKRKNLLDFTNLFSPNKYEKNDTILLKNFQELKRLKWKTSIALFVVSIVYIYSTGFSNWGRKQHNLLNATDNN